MESSPASGYEAEHDEILLTAEHMMTSAPSSDTYVQWILLKGIPMPFMVELSDVVFGLHLLKANAITEVAGCC